MLKNEIIRGESSTLEFKKELPSKDRKYIKTVVAFANSKGGRLVFGVDDATLQIVGVEVTSINRTLDSITNAIVDNCQPQLVPDITLETVDDKTLIVVRVYPGRSTPYYIKSEGLNNGTYIRVGATTRRAEGEILLDLVLKGQRLHYDETFPGNEAPATQQEIDTLCTYIEQRVGKNKGEVTTDHLISWQLLKEQEDHSLQPSVAFCLLARPRSIYFSRIQCALFKGTDKVHFLDRKEFEGPLYQLIDEVENFVIKHTRVAARIEGTYRQDLYEIPLPALRELIVNAILHRNYLRNSFIQVSIYDDRIEFFSPGGLYGDITPEKMLAGGSSSLRNPLLADVFHKMRIVEKWGTGIRRIFESFQEARLPVPEYKVSDSDVLITVRRQLIDPTSYRFYPPPHFKEQVLTAQESSGADEGYTNRPPAPLPPQKAARKVRTIIAEQDILDYIQHNQPVSFSTLCSTFNISRRTVALKLETLHKQGLIQRRGQTRNAVWYTTQPQ